MIAWLLFGGGPLLAALWVAAAAMRVAEADRLPAIGRAAAQGCAGLIVLYGSAGAALLFLAVVMRGG